MTKEVKGVGVVDLERTNCSTNGNPKYLVYFSNDTTQLQGKTATDYSFCYNLPYRCHAKKAEVTYHITPTGRVVFTNIVITN